MDSQELMKSPYSLIECPNNYVLSVMKPTDLSFRFKSFLQNWKESSIHLNTDSIDTLSTKM